jgi:hypothetical protein
LVENVFSDRQQPIAPLTRHSPAGKEPLINSLFEIKILKNQKVAPNLALSATESETI